MRSATVAPSVFRYEFADFDTRDTVQLTVAALPSGDLVVEHALVSSGEVHPSGQVTFASEARETATALAVMSQGSVVADAAVSEGAIPSSWAAPFAFPRRLLERPP